MSAIATATAPAATAAPADHGRRTLAALVDLLVVDRVPCAVVYAAARSDHATAVEHAVEAL